VVGIDGGLGRVQQVLISPDSGDVSGLVLGRRPLFDRRVAVPIEAFDQSTDDEVRLRLTVAHLNRLADRQQGKTPPEALLHESGRSTTRGRAVTRPLKAAQRVVCRGGDVGSVVLVLLDAATRRTTHLVVRPPDLLGRDRMVPLDWIREITDERIVLGSAHDQFEQLPEYRADEEITAAVVSQLWCRSDVDPGDLRHVTVRTRDGGVALGGKTGTNRSRTAIETRARGVRGVLGVRNRLRTFEALSMASRARNAAAGMGQGGLGPRSRPGVVLGPGTVPTLRITVPARSTGFSPVAWGRMSRYTLSTGSSPGSSSASARSARRTSRIGVLPLNPQGGTGGSVVIDQPAVARYLSPAHDGTPSCHLLPRRLADRGNVLVRAFAANRQSCSHSGLSGEPCA
jgi:sporulation protein YlmC with PRC-barrel domain